MAIFIKRFLEAMILPPGIVVLLLGLTMYLLVRKKGNKMGPAWPLLTVSLAMGLLLGFSLPTTSARLLQKLEVSPAFPALKEEKLATIPAQAIVILGCGQSRNAQEYGGLDTLTGCGMARAQYGAWIQEKTGLPILTSGGTPLGEPVSEAMVMKHVLERSFHTPVRWLEEKSVNTRENATFSMEILRSQGIDHIFLVTHASHMARALWFFKKTGTLTITPAPTGFSSGLPPGVLAWIPSAGTACQSSIALHEMLGMQFYQWQEALTTW